MVPSSPVTTVTKRSGVENPIHGHSHSREEASYFLEIKGDVREAMPYASANWESQREAPDLLILVKAALAADDEVTEASVRKWIDQRAFEDIHDDRQCDQEGESTRERGLGSPR